MNKANASVVPWAQIRVLRGETPCKLAFRSDQPDRIVVGSDPSAALCLRGPDVAPRQLDVVWDGTNLWLEDALRLGRTFVSGRPLNEWVAIHGQVIVSFGAVRLWVASGGPLPASNVPNFAALERAQIVPAARSEERRRDTGRITVPPELARAFTRE